MFCIVFKINDNKGGRVGLAVGHVATPDCAVVWAPQGGRVVIGSDSAGRSVAATSSTPWMLSHYLKIAVVIEGKWQEIWVHRESLAKRYSDPKDGAVLWKLHWMGAASLLRTAVLRQSDDCLSDDQICRVFTVVRRAFADSSTLGACKVDIPGSRRFCVVNGQEAYLVLSDTEKDKMLGKGGCATVWAGVSMPEAFEVVAVKQMRRVKSYSKSTWDGLVGEASLQMQFRGESGVAQAMCYVESEASTDGKPAELNIVMSRYANGTVEDFLENRKAYSLKGRLELLQKALVGLNALHNQGVIHNDVKRGNFLVNTKLDGSIEVVISDFGFSGKVPRIESGTAKYLAPEKWRKLQLLAVGRRDVVWTSENGKADDMWAFGCMCFEVLTQRSLWSGLSEPLVKAFAEGKINEAALQQRVDELIDATKTPLLVKQFLKSLLSVNCDNRFTSAAAAEALTALLAEDSVLEKPSL